MVKIVKNKGGAPTKFSPDVYDKVEEYLRTTGREQTSLPTIEGLAEYLDVDSDTIRNWSKEHKQFFVTIKKLVEKQKKQLMDDGMYGGKEVNAAMAIFLLKANHGLKEPPTSLTQVNVGKDMGVEIILDETASQS